MFANLRLSEGARQRHRTYGIHTVRTASYDVPPAPDRIPHFIINIALYILVIIIIIYYYYYYIRDITESS